MMIIDDSYNDSDTETNKKRGEEKSSKTAFAIWCFCEAARCCASSSHIFFRCSHFSIYSTDVFSCCCLCAGRVARTFQTVVALFEIIPVGFFFGAFLFLYITLAARARNFICKWRIARQSRKKHNDNENFPILCESLSCVYDSFVMFHFVFILILYDFLFVSLQRKKSTFLFIFTEAGARARSVRQYMAVMTCL